MFQTSVYKRDEGILASLKKILAVGFNVKSNRLE
jgi:hypothetical protein